MPFFSGDFCATVGSGKRAGGFFSGVLLLLLFFVDQTEEEEEDNKRGRKRKSERTPGARNAARIGHRVVHIPKVIIFDSLFFGGFSPTRARSTGCHVYSLKDPLNALYPTPAIIKPSGDCEK